MRNFKQLKDGIIAFFEGNDMVESVFMAKTADDALDFDRPMRYVAFSPNNFSIGKTNWMLSFAFVINTKVPLGDEDAWITAQEEHVLLTAQLKDLMDLNDVDADIDQAMFALPEEYNDSAIVTATFVLNVEFQRVQYKNFDE